MREEKSRQFPLAFSSGHLQVGACPCQENKYRSTEVCDPARQEELHARVRKVSRIITLQSIAMDKIARVVKHHDDHHRGVDQSNLYECGSVWQALVECQPGPAESFQG